VGPRSREAVKQIEDLLIEKGFRCTVEQETLLEHSGLFNFYATRSKAEDGMREIVELARADALREV